MERFSGFKNSLEQAWHSVSDGWHHLIDRASGALTRFTPSTREADDAAHDEAKHEVTLEPATGGWGLLAGDMFEDDEKLLVRLEVPGIRREDFDLEVRSDLLVVRGEKRFEEERQQGHYRMRQCAYGRFHRTFPLPVTVDAEGASARYDNGVLRVELPKRTPTRGHRIRIQP